LWVQQGRNLSKTFSGQVAQPDPLPTFMATPADGRADHGTVIHASLLVMLTTVSRQFAEQRLCVLQIGGVEAFGEPAVDRREKVAGFGPSALLAPEPGEISSGA
jgi:hypothetical protein